MMTVVHEFSAALALARPLANPPFLLLGHCTLVVALQDVVAVTLLGIYS